MIGKAYLGDSVYYEHDGYGAILTTENGMGASNTIVLEPETVVKLLEAFASNREADKLISVLQRSRVKP